MRVFLAGATGVLGIRLVALLVEHGHVVAGTSRSASRAQAVRDLGGEPIVLDVFDADELRVQVAAFAPDLVMHQLTDLPDDPATLERFAQRNDRIRGEGTRNLLAAAAAAAATRVLAQSIAWTPGRGRAAIDEHERLVLEAGGVILRYGRLYGSGTWYDGTLPEPPRISVERAAQETVELLNARSGVITLAE